MVWNLPELSLDLSPPTVANSIPGFLTVLPLDGNWDSDELSKLHDFIDGLENELGKIEAFKRELPLSFLLLNDAIGKLKEEARKHDERRGRCKLDESAGAKMGIDQSEKKSWMSSAQLWSPRYEEEGSGFSDDAVPGLSLVIPGFDTQATVEPDLTGDKLVEPVLYRTVEQTAKPQIKLPYPYHQTARKQRRCWSPDLHRRFVDALEKLGGSQVATPKQIRELMQVDGLTNDEVKSHLQKYRLHVRKLSSSVTSNPSSNDDTSTGGDGLGSSIRLTGSPVGPLHLSRSGKCNSTSMEDDEDEEKSDGQSWKLHNQIMV